MKIAIIEFHTITFQQIVRIDEIEVHINGYFQHSLIMMRYSMYYNI